MNARAHLIIGFTAMLAAIAMTTGLFLNTAWTEESAVPAQRCVVVWSEGTAGTDVYPKDINGAIAEGLASLEGWEVVTASLNDPDQGLPDALLHRADVLVWWGHKKHGLVKDKLVRKIVKRVKEDGMGFISLHSAHFAKPNKELMGTACSWGAYEADSTTLKVTVKEPDHPIAKGVKDFTVEHSERYSEPYAVPEPQAVPFEGVHTLANGTEDPSRIGLCWQVGKGKFFYFQAGHETNPIFYDENVRLIMRNAVEWAAPANQ
ncbi:MAG: trehalose utilization protein [Candidatus Hydrogenedentes bacterium]|nr:trehalose utilization protein [Candidatus Hydrogenedentota bacterium]